MSNRTLNIFKLVFLLLILIPLCVISYRIVVKGSLNMSILGFSNGEVVKQESFADVSALRTDLVSCSVNVTTHAADGVSVTIRKVGLGSQGKNMPSVKLDGDVLAITEPRVIMSFSVTGYIVDVAVPASSRMDYDLSTISGHVHLDAMSDNAKLHSTSGAVRVDASCVDVVAESTSGSIRIRGDESTKSVRANNTSGSIRIAAGENVQTIDADNTSGSIRISIPARLGYTMDYSSVSGSIKDDYRGIKYDKHGSALMKGDGEVKITAHNVSGGIKLEDWE